MQVNANLFERVVVDTNAVEWAPSPAGGVNRRMLERDGAEAGRATSIVRYEPGARFSSHTHPMGEEIFVLAGVFSDESGSYGPGTYLKNACGSSHAPYSAEGCTLLVKLCHLEDADTEHVAINTASAAWHQGLVPGLKVMPLSEYGTANVALVRWAPGTFFNPHRHYGGEEIYVLSCVFEDEHGRYPEGTWIRSPHMSAHKPFSREGCTILVRTGHLPTELPT
jgi:anti-sigma factor ChrR (cupin superfamily)